MPKACLDDDTILGFVEGRLTKAELTAVEEHAGACIACEQRLGAGLAAMSEVRVDLKAAAPPLLDLQRGSSVGRYTVLALVGRGGMGEVYAAYDPKLDRKIALKLLHPGGFGADSHSETRLLREAQAIARLSHPNVVVVYDAGEIGDRVFLTMEYIEGPTLADWLRAPRSWREIRDVFVAAGSGLAAAHEAGLVHRDFKPQNVMVGADGTARVMDFGLASDAAGTHGEIRGETGTRAPGGPVVARLPALTRTGTLLGTPLYMAPEQFESRATDARTDQFSFCVALYEALYREHPFGAGTLAELSKAVGSGRVREPTSRASVPGFLRKLLLRGLKRAPDRRFASMSALLEELKRDPARERRRIAVASVIAVCALALVPAARLLAGRGARLCHAGNDRIRAAWEREGRGARRDAVRAAFLATGRPYAEETWSRVSRLLDDYASRWSDMYTDACEATQVRGDQSSEVMDLRMTCLEGPRASLRALTEELSRADRAVLVHAVNAAQALPPIDRCLDVSALRASVPPPADAALRARVGALRLELPRIQALSDTGQWMEARGSIEPIVAAARTLGYGPLIAEALKPLGWLQYFMGDVELAADTMESALWAAVASHQDDVALDCAAYLVAVAGYHLGHYADAARWEQFGRALLGRLGPGHEAAQAWLLHNRGLNRQRQGNYQAALADLEEGLAMKRRILPPNHPDIGIVLEAIANVRTDMKDKEGAVAAIREALAIFEKAYGSSSPLLARTLGNLGEIERTRGDYAAAERDLRASIDRWREQVPPDHPWIAYPLTQLGKTLASEHRPEEAIVVLERALRIREHAEPTVELIAETRFALARALWQSPSGRTRAGRLAEQALEGYREAKGHEQDATAVSAWLGEQRRGASDRHRSAVEAPGRGVAANQTQLGFTHGTHVRVLPLLRPEGPPDRAVRASRKHVDTTVAP